MTTDHFAERFAVVRDRFAAKIDARIAEIEAAVPELSIAGARDALERAHRRAHDLCGIGPTMGYVATGHAARIVEQTLLAAIKGARTLGADEIARLRQDIAALRAAARSEKAPSTE